MTELSKPYVVEQTDDWEEQCFANSSPTDPNNPSMLPQFGPTPPHVRETSRWKPQSAAPYFQKHPDRIRP